MQKLERGGVLSEENEYRIEHALDWEVGGLDRIRSGGEPIAKTQHVPPTDPEERDLYDRLFPLSHEERMQTIAVVMEQRRHRGTGT